MGSHLRGSDMKLSLSVVFDRRKWPLMMRVYMMADESVPVTNENQDTSVGNNCEHNMEEEKEDEKELLQPMHPS
ncbi:hypothetical protein PR048_031485 [Dryococelus australis]|uniref:Uncharacterized protein n=1 Tax=Dryococelus australis TaxID=614101 RepID=A0ABQ9G5E7_9NEOP|nr:hypothetical protein PR048_031485 [Dryococelus australis]